MYPETSTAFLYYGRIWGYYRNSWNNYYQPGYYENTKKYQVETNVYSLKRDKLVWSGVTITVDPQNAEQLRHGISSTIFKQMKKEKFIIIINQSCLKKELNNFYTCQFSAKKNIIKTLLPFLSYY